MKKAFSVTVIAVILVLTVLMNCSFAEDRGTCGVSAAWSWDSATSTLTVSGTGEIQNYGAGAFAPWKSFAINIKHIIVESGITSIGNYAFSMCENTETVSLPDSVTSIGEYAFAWDYALESITIPKNTEKIGNEAFVWCEKLTEVTIPAKTVSIGDNVFQWCSSIKQFNVLADNTKYAVLDGVLYDKEIKLLILYPNGKTSGYFKVPQTVTKIGQNAFAGNEKLTGIMLSDSVTEIDTSAFFECKALETISLSKSLKAIGSSAFYGCEKLVEVSIPDSVTRISDGAFKKCGKLKYVLMPDTDVSFGNDIFKKSEQVALVSNRNTSAQKYANANSITFCAYTTVFLDGKEIEFDAKPFVRNGSTLVPMRAIFEALGSVVTWDAPTQTATGTKGSTTVKLSINSSKMYKNNNEIILNVPAELISGRTLAPLRAVSEAFDVNVEWDGDNYMVKMFNK